MDLAMSGTAPWRSQCHAAGGFATVFPTGYPFAGLPACRTQDPDGTLHYHMVAPVTDYVELLIANGWDEFTAKTEGAAASAALDTIDTLKGAVPAAVSWLTGIPTWVLWGVGAYVLWRFLDVKLPRRAS